MLSHHYNGCCSQYLTTRLMSSYRELLLIARNGVLTDVCNSPYSLCIQSRPEGLGKTVGAGNSYDIILLAGPPCSGKTAVGSLAAPLLTIDFVEVDHMVEAQATMTIQEIFWKGGEEEFRRLESVSFNEVMNFRNILVTVGGGCLLDPEHLKLAKERCLIITLTADLQTLWNRCSFQGGRPLAPDRASFMKLMEERKEHYASLPNQIDTTRIPPQAVAGEVVRLVKSRRGW